MFVNSDYLNYKYVVDCSDNYVVLAKQSSVSADWQSPRTIDVIYQYLYPSILTVETTRTFNSSEIFNAIDVSDAYFSRADCPIVLTVTFILIFFITFIFNGMTRFVKRGGVFFGT